MADRQQFSLDLPAAWTAVRTSDGDLCLEAGQDGRIVAVSPAPAAAGDDLHTVTLGLVDLQVNGFAGVDFNRPSVTPESLDRALAAMLATGVTRCLPTVITASEAHLAACLAALDQAAGASRLGPAMVAGFHLEGPFISGEPGYVGCHPAHHTRAPDRALFERLQRAAGGRIRMVTVAPELAGAADFIRDLAADGVTPALGHTSASAAEIERAIAAGARLSTHLGNGTARLLPKSDNVILRQLAEDRLAATFIADGLHLSPDVVRVYMRAKTMMRSALVTDAVAAAAAPAGRYSLGELAVDRGEDGSARSSSGALAGSALTMADAVRNVRAWIGCDWRDILALARTRPLGVLGDEAMPRPGDLVELVAWEGDRVAAARIGTFAVRNAPARQRAERLADIACR